MVRSRLPRRHDPQGTGPDRDGDRRPTDHAAVRLDELARMGLDGHLLSARPIDPPVGNPTESPLDEGLPAGA